MIESWGREMWGHLEEPFANPYLIYHGSKLTMITSTGIRNVLAMNFLVKGSMSGAEMVRGYEAMVEENSRVMNWN